MQTYIKNMVGGTQEKNQTTIENSLFTLYFKVRLVYQHRTHDIRGSKLLYTKFE